MTAQQTTYTDYSADRLFGALKTQFGKKNNQALAAFLGIKPPMISKVRHARTMVSAELMITIHEKTGMPIAEIKRLVGPPSAFVVVNELVHGSQRIVRANAVERPRPMAPAKS